MSSRFRVLQVLAALILVAGCNREVPAQPVDAAGEKRSAPALPPLPPPFPANGAKVRAIAAAAVSSRTNSMRVASGPSLRTVQLLSTNSSDPNLVYPFALVVWTRPDPVDARNNVLFTNLVSSVIYSVECCQDGTNWRTMGWYHQVQEFDGEKNLGLALIDRHPGRGALWRLRSTLAPQRSLPTLAHDRP